MIGAILAKLYGDSLSELYRINTGEQDTATEPYSAHASHTTYKQRLIEDKIACCQGLLMLRRAQLQRY